MIAGTALTGFLIFFVAPVVMLYIYVCLLNRYWPVVKYDKIDDDESVTLISDEEFREMDLE